ncbi:MAG: zinc ribbon domain-containing protein [Armatimonadetes bacterium]|nr:zinc ribbon domain-containing protein [Armatimonadota bacterium]
MTYTYTCAKCGEIVEFTCSIAEKEEREKSLVCPSCNSREFYRVFNAFIARKRETSGSSSRCATCSATSCSTCR